MLYEALGISERFEVSHSLVFGQSYVGVGDRVVWALPFQSERRNPGLTRNGGSPQARPRLHRSVKGCPSCPSLKVSKGILLISFGNLPFSRCQWIRYRSLRSFRQVYFFPISRRSLRKKSASAFACNHGSAQDQGRCASTT